VGLSEKSENVSGGKGGGIGRFFFFFEQTANHTTPPHTAHHRVFCRWAKTRKHNFNFEHFRPNVDRKNVRAQCGRSLPDFRTFYGSAKSHGDQKEKKRMQNKKRITLSFFCRPNVRYFVGNGRKGGGGECVCEFVSVFFFAQEICCLFK